jgi:hypothetical protein
MHGEAMLQPRIRAGARARVPERDHSFAEPVALSSTGPANFRLPPTVAGPDFDLVALRARRRQDTRGLSTLWQDPSGTVPALFAKSSIFHISTADLAACGKRALTTNQAVRVERWRG